MPRMQAAAGKQPLRVFFGVLGDELVHARGESNHFRRHVINQHRAVDTGFIKMLEKGAWGTAELGDLLEVRPLVLHQLQRVRFEHLHGLDVNVAVGYQVVGPWPLVVAAANSARLVKTRIISRRYSGVSADVVNGLAVRAERLAAVSARLSSTALPRSSSGTPLTSTGAGLTAVKAIRASSMWPFERLTTTAT